MQNTIYTFEYTRDTITVKRHDDHPTMHVARAGGRTYLAWEHEPGYVAVQPIGQDVAHSTHPYMNGREDVPTPELIAAGVSAYRIRHEAVDNA